MPPCPHEDEQSMRFANFFLRLPRAGVVPGVRRADFMQKWLINEGASLIDFRLGGSDGREGAGFVMHRDGGADQR